MPAKQNKSAAARIVRRIIRWLVAVSILAVVLWFGFMLLGRVLCHIAIGQIAELTNTRIETGSVDFRPNGSVFIEKLVISPYKKAGPGKVILNAEKVHARFSVGSLLLLRPHLKQIDVNDFTFNAQYDLDTRRWNLSALKIKAPKNTSGKMPLVRLETGRLQYTKVSKGEVKVAASVPVSAKFGFDQQGQGGYSFDFTTATLSSGFGKSRLKGLWKPGSVTIAGGISSADVPALEMAWTIDVIAAEFKYDSNDAFSLDLRIKKLHSKRSPPLDNFALMGPNFIERSAPFGALRRFFNRYSPSGLVDVKVEASGNLKRLGESTLTGNVGCNDVAISYNKFPYRIERLKGRIDFTKDGVTLDNLSGRHGDVELLFNGWTRGFAPDWKYDIRITSDNMVLDADLYDALSEKQKGFWSAFSPSGRAVIDYRFTRSSPDERAKHLVVELQGVEAAYRNFPYPLKNLTGKLSFEPERVVISDIVSQVDGRRIALDGEVMGRGTDRTAYDILIKVNNIPLDPVLEAALPKEQKDLYSEFGPTGLADGKIRVSKPDQTSVPATFTADLSFKEASLKSEQLLLPVTEITAGAVFASDLISIKNFSGRYGGSPVSLSGQIWPGQNDQPARYDLSLNFKETTLNDDLFDLLPKSARKIVTEFHPQGKIDLSADLNKLDANDYPDYKITVNCLGNSVDFPQFSYPLKDITGTLTITPETIKFEDVNASPGDTVWIRSNKAYIKLNGGVTLAEGAFSSAVLEVDANDIYFERRLGAALPAAIRPFCNRLGTHSRFDLDLDQLKVTLDDAGDKVVDINGVIRLKDCSAQISGAKTKFDAEFDLDKLRITPANDGEKNIDIRGLIRLKDCSVQVSGTTIASSAELGVTGLYKTGHGFESCHVFLDGGRFKILGKSFTNVTADIYFDGDLHKWTSENLSADCYDGKLTGKLEFEQSADGPLEYVLQTGFENVDLRKFLLDTRMKGGPEQDRTTGKMEGSLNIRARAGEGSSRIGTCKLSIVDMQVGRLSPLAKLLAVLRFTEPTEFAFDRMFVDSYIRHNDLLVRKLDLSGESVAFYGSGSMDLQKRDINLDLIARGQRLATADPSILESLAEGLGQAVVKIEVSGDFYDPQIITRPLPFIKGTLEILGKPIEPK